MSEILICSGPIKSGKTTRLMQWAAGKKKINGIFQPVIDEKRFLYHIGSRTLRKLETSDESGTTDIGKYRFSNESFEWAKHLLLNSMQREIDWLIIDEIGPLEFDGKGLEPVVTKIINERNKLNCRIICVVRERLLEKFLSHYRLDNSYKIFDAVQF